MRIANKTWILLVAILAAIELGTQPVRVVHSSAQRSDTSPIYNVKTFGATGDGKTLDTPAINKTIDAAAAGGATVYFPAADYLYGPIHLKRDIALDLDQGGTIIAASPSVVGRYDPREPNEWDKYQ